MSVRLPDPFSHPGLIPGFTAGSLVDNEPVFVDELPNGKVLEATASAQYWSVNIEYPEMTPDEFSILSSAYYTAKSGDGKFMVVLPQYLSTAVPDASTCTIASGQTGNSLVIDNFPASLGTPEVFKLFTLSNSTKVYKITSVSRTGNTVTLGTYPSLTVETAGDEIADFYTVMFTMKLSSSRGDFTENLNTEGYYDSVSFNLRESIE